MSTTVLESTQYANPELLSEIGSCPSVRARSRFEMTAIATEQFLDALTIALAVMASFAVYSSLNFEENIHYSNLAIVGGAAIFALVFVAMFALDGGYQRGSSLLSVRETERILRASAKSLLIALCTSVIAAEFISRAMLLISVALVPLCVTIEKQLFYILLKDLHRRGYGIQKVIIYGSGATGRRIYSALTRSPKLGLKPVAIVDDDLRRVGRTVHEYSYHRSQYIRVIAGPLTDTMIRQRGADMIIVAIPSISKERLNYIAGISASSGAAVGFAPRLSVNSDRLVNYIDVDGVLISSLPVPAQKTAYDMAKRICDVLASVILLALLAPFLLLIALVIRLDSCGPPLFTQLRAGKNGMPFRIFKFRTMRVETLKYSVHPKDDRDPRITRIGRWLRRTSLDEFPQLINVLKGEMSLVGPRPEMLFIVDRYKEGERQRLRVIPGLTGLWQLSADRAFPIHENIHYDLYYVRNRNFFMDIAILLHTLVFAARGV